MYQQKAKKKNENRKKYHVVPLVKVAILVTGRMAQVVSNQIERFTDGRGYSL